MSIVQQQEQIILVLFACPVCNKYYQKGAFASATACVTKHELGECCHYSDRELDQDTLEKVLQRIQHPSKQPKEKKTKKK